MNLNNYDYLPTALRRYDGVRLTWLRARNKHPAWASCEENANARTVIHLAREEALVRWHDGADPVLCLLFYCSTGPSNPVPVDLDADPRRLCVTCAKQAPEQPWWEAA